MRKPAPKEPLSKALAGPRHPAFCQSCGTSGSLHPRLGEAQAMATLQAWRECDLSDKPTKTVVILCLKCEKKLVERHALLYIELLPFEPRPGSMPVCCNCRDCEDLQCKSAELRANGGPGVRLVYPQPARVIARTSKRLNGSRCHQMTLYTAPVQCLSKKPMPSEDLMERAEALQ